MKSLNAEEREIIVDRETLEFRYHGEVIPDLHLQVGDTNPFVEIAVTHPRGEKKISRLKRLKPAAAVEIDLSSVPRSKPVPSGSPSCAPAHSAHPE
ncbi:hypothetical protein [Mesorhizobium sp. M0296]|uniref:hypothetical protein n=1 Tax=Mesorhizobium sp. M0296 TaxID=2956931 RepID=UPI003339EE58